jgi:hypothetical protein
MKVHWGLEAITLEINLTGPVCCAYNEDFVSDACACIAKLISYPSGLSRRCRTFPKSKSKHMMNQQACYRACSFAIWILLLRYQVICNKTCLSMLTFRNVRRGTFMFGFHELNSFQYKCLDVTFMFMFGFHVWISCLDFMFGFHVHDLGPKMGPTIQLNGPLYMCPLHLHKP